MPLPVAPLPVLLPVPRQESPGAVAVPSKALVITRITTTYGRYDITVIKRFINWLIATK